MTRAADELSPADREVLDAWWQTFVATGRLPAGLALVQGRLVRAVYRGEMPSGPVYLKAMTFPRAKDRLRYLLRPLPGAHEAAMLRATAAAGIVCPEVVAVRTLRRAGLPFRSLLVLRALSVREEVPGSAAARLGEEAALAAHLLAAGIVHPDLHGGNFVRCVDGGLAVLDLQSARRRRATQRDRVAIAARLLQDRRDLDAAVATPLLVAASLLRGADEGARAHEAAAAARRAFVRGRILRCLTESTEFARAVSWRGVEHRTRGELPPGRWWHGGCALRRAWIGQRALSVVDGRSPVFPAFLQKWWWLGGGGALYVPAACSDDRIAVEVRASADGYVRLLALDPRSQHSP